jgi:hypothetical protein
MDHLPRVVGAIAPLTKVPCVCDPHSFDGNAFETFPTRKGYRLIVQDGFPKFILNADGSRLTSEQLASIAQAWLFFGLLTEVLKISGTLLDPEDFIQREGTNVYITTGLLPHYLERWVRAESALPMKTRQAHFRRQQATIILAMCFRFHQISDQWIHDGDVWSFYEQPAERYKMTLPLPTELSFCILESALDRASRRAYGIAHDREEASFLCKGLIEDLHRGGWCPSEKSLILQLFGDTSAFFASRLDRGRTKVDHSGCSTNKCLAFNINTEEYKTRHTDGCSGCMEVSINNDELATILRLNKTPRVRVRVQVIDEEPQIALTLTDSGPYVAISHVWSDGLGNATANSLPSCQLLRLHNLTMNLGIEFAQDISSFWIDSLLVPVKKGVEKRLALDRLPQYYREAAKVLVLDSDLLQASQFSSQEEQMTRVFFCTWMRRLWTLEEGTLSRDRLEFQFRDGTISMKHLTQTSTVSCCLDNIGNGLNAILKIFLPDMANRYRQQPGTPQNRLNTILDLLPVLQYRSTTKAADEPLCISHILGLDTSTLTCIDEANLRMKELIRILTEHGTLFPRRLLFTNEPKLQIEGTRWAPASFMAFDREDAEYLIQGSSKQYSTYSIDEGLLVDGLRGFMLDFGNETFKNVTFVEVDKVIYALTPAPIGENCRQKDRFWSRQRQEIASEIGSARQWSYGCQELIGKSPRRTAVVYEKAYPALLVFVYCEQQSDEKDDFLLYARPISRLHIYELKVQDHNYVAEGADSSVIRFTNPDWDFERTELQMHAELGKFHNPATSTFLRCPAIGPSQRWCIG